jgi:hypothetical protein
VAGLSDVGHPALVFEDEELDEEGVGFAVEVGAGLEGGGAAAQEFPGARSIVQYGW